ncbi:MAG: bacillithiol biosynthesis cysteine-adding enzyme BshC [Pyrinomonadaceae bacterium]
MSTLEAACFSSPEEAGLEVERLAFDSIPHASRLFLDYLRDPAALRKFYPNTVRFHHELAARAPETLLRYETDRTSLCDALRDMNEGWGATPETLTNVERLRATDSVAVVSGQQIGLFTGPLYTIYKALSAVKLAKCLTSRGTESVPIFWLATEDHDWKEVQAAEFIACDGRLAKASVANEMHTGGMPVGEVVIDDSINETITRTLDVLPTTEFSPELKETLTDAYLPGRTYTDAFARTLNYLMGRYGLVLLDPLDARLKRLAAPLYVRAARRAPELARALYERSRELEASGYHAQVFASEDTFPVFLHVDGARRALARTKEGRYRAKGDGRKEYTAEELADLAAVEPQRFSPNVTLRAVVQDYLLPTVAYLGGAAEIAYFAQTSEVYRVLERPATPILHRASLSIVERRTRRTLQRYNLHLRDFFAGYDAVTRRVVEEHLGAEAARLFDDTEKSVQSQLDSLENGLQNFDPTLADALATTKRKVNHQLEALRSRFHRAQMSRDRAAHRQLERAFTALYPEKNLQERRINITSLFARHGRYVIDWIHDAIDLGTTDHEIVYL